MAMKSMATDQGTPVASFAPFLVPCHTDLDNRNAAERLHFTSWPLPHHLNQVYKKLIPALVWQGLVSTGYHHMVNPASLHPFILTTISFQDHGLSHDTVRLLSGSQLSLLAVKPTHFFLYFCALQPI